MPSAARAQAGDADYNSLFKRTYAQPEDVALAFRFAQVAAQVGDYEAAIGALERVLFFTADARRVKLELGILYFKLGAYQMARSRLEEAAAGDAPGDIKVRAQDFLSEIDARLSPHRWNVFAHTGLRYQTNASAGPGGTIRALSQDVTINERFAKSADWNWFGVFGADYRYNLQHGNEDALEASVLGYQSQQFRLSQFNLGLVEAAAGPRFSLPNIPGASIKPYALVAATSLANRTFFNGPGAGLAMRFNIEGFGRVEPYAEYRYRRFADSGAYPTASQQTGGLITAALIADGKIGGVVPFYGRIAYDHNKTDSSADDFNSYDRWSADIGLPFRIAYPHDSQGRTFVVTPLVGVSRTDYAGPNPAVDATTTRFDREWHAGALFDVQIYKAFGLRTQLLYSQTASTLSNYEFSNFSVTLGPTGRF